MGSEERTTTPVTSVRNDFTCASFPIIRFDPAPSPRNPLALKPAREPDPNPIPYVFLPPRKPPGSQDAYKYYHKHDEIESKNRHTIALSMSKRLWQADLRDLPERP
jgi:hypothetical protein